MSNFKRKNIIFHIDKNNQLLGSFHENSKFKLIRAYFRDISNIPEFNLIFNDQIISDDEITLKFLTSKVDVIINVEDIRKMQLEQGKNSSNESIRKLERKNKELEKHCEIFKDEMSKI